MGRIYEQKQIRFDGGISDDTREPKSNVGALIKHFDIFSNPYRLTPHRSSEADTATNVSATDAKQYDIRHFQLGLDGKLYGLAKVVATGYPKMVKKTDPTTGNWLSSAGNNMSTAEGEGNAARILGCFIEWQSAFWFLQGTNQVAKCTLAGTITNSVATVGSTITTTAQGIVFGDNLFIAYNNKVFKVSSAGAVTDDVTPALPSDMRITSLARFGNYIVIGMAYGTSATAAPTGRSFAYVWDGSSTSVFSDVIDWGEGALMALGNIEGAICGVTDKYLSSALGLAKGSMVVRLWSGGIPRVIKEIVANQTVTLGRFLNEVVVKNNKMYWVASVPFGLSTSTESTYHLGIWCFGRKNQNSNFTITIDQIEEAIDTSNFKINSFGAAGDYWFINHSADFSITKTDDAANYTETSIYETQIFNGGSSSIQKKLIGATVDTVALPAAGQVVLKYRINEETSYTTIFTNATDNSLSHSAINIESNGNNLPQWRETQFRIESTGFAEVVGLSFAYEEIDTKLY